MCPHKSASVTLEDRVCGSERGQDMRDFKRSSESLSAQVIWETYETQQRRIPSERLQKCFAMRKLE